MKMVPTLNFAGSCREAMQLYEKAFGGKITCMVTYGEANDPAYTPYMTEKKKSCIYHGELMVGENRIIMSDQVDMELNVCHTNYLTMMCDSVEQVQHAYEMLQEGSTTIYPMERTPFSACRVVFVDRFGIRWGMMVEG